MLVREAIELLRAMPQDATLIADSQAEMLRVPMEGEAVAGYKRERYEFLLFEKQGLVVLCLTANANGEEMR